jgi:lysyl-tRNA synthetase, class I
MISCPAALTSYLTIPTTIEEVIANYDTREETFSCMEVQSDLSVARQALQSPTADEDKGAWAELLAFSLAGTEHYEKPWGTYFGPMGSGTRADGTIVYFPDTTEADASILAHWKARAASCKAPALTARYSDLVWDLSMLVAGEKRDVTYARLAISSYLATAAQPGRDNYDCFPDAERALTLAIQISDNVGRDAARKIMLDLHAAELAGNGMWWRAPRFLADQPKAALTEAERRGIIADLEAILKQASDVSSPSTFNPHDAESAAKMLEPHYRRQNENERIPDLDLAVAQAFEHMGAMSDPMLAAMVYQTSADAFGRAGRNDEAERVQRLVQASNIAAAEQMKPHEFTMEVSKDEIEQVLVSLVKGSKYETFKRLATQFMLRRQPLEEFLAGAAKKFPLSTIMPQSMMQDDRVVAQIGALADDPDGHLIMQASRHLMLNNAWLTWAFERASETYDWSPNDIVSWANRTGLFGDGLLMSEGVEAWFAKDNVKAVHILVPQIEAAFRRMAGVLGRPTTKPHPQMTRARMVIPLGELLWAPETAQALGDLGGDLVLHMRTLYTDPRGHNLRNDLAHGLIASTSINATTALLVIHTLLLLGSWLEPKATVA